MTAKTEIDPATLAHARTLTNTPWCDDYEKMISGVLYDCHAPELVSGRFRARRFMHKYNSYFPDAATPESLASDRQAMLQEIFGKVGKDVFIEPPLNIDYGCNVSLGDGFYSNFKRVSTHSTPHFTYLVILDCGMVTIGHRVMFGPFVSIFAATHEVGVQSRRDGVEYAAPVAIGDDCWIGGNVTIMPGVTIGKGCTIGAGSVVTKDIPDFSVAIGSPAKVVKKVDPVPDIEDKNRERDGDKKAQTIPEP